MFARMAVRGAMRLPMTVPARAARFSTFKARPRVGLAASLAGFRHSNGVTARGLRFNSSQSPKYNINGERELSDEEAQTLLKEMKAIWEDKSLDDEAQRDALNKLLGKYEIGGMISPSASKMISTILTDADANKPGEKVDHVQRFHRALMDYHMKEQLKFNGEFDNKFNPPPKDGGKFGKEGKAPGKASGTEETKEEREARNAKVFVAELKYEWLLIWTGIAILLMYMMGSGNGDKEITWQDFRASFLDKGYVAKLIVVNNDTVRIVLNQRGLAQPTNGNGEYYFTISSVENFERRLKKAQENVPDDQQIPVTYVHSASIAKALFGILPSVLLFAFIFWSTSKIMKSGGVGGVFGNKKEFKKFNAEQHVKIKFADVAGCDEAKEEIMEFVSFLKHPEHYEKLGAKIPRGAILAGPPGTGKTLLAKATAGEAGVPFYSVSGSEFVEMFVGVGASRVRELFKTARDNAPSIVFVDEIDAIGKARGKGKGTGGNDERENTLNQLLVEMDGFQNSDQVVVLAGTNRADVLDPALMRPGRFDRKIYLSNPELEGRKAIFGVHLKQIKLSPDCDIEDLKGKLATLTPGFSGADIANVCNEAALTAARNGGDFVEEHDFEQAIERVIGGLEKKSKVLSPQEKKVVAYHEAGHAICGWFMQYADPLLKVSIVPRGQSALGYAQYLPPDIYLYSTQKLMDQMTMTLGGRVSEELHFDSVTSGASNDFEKVTNIAQRMVMACGLSKKVGLISYDMDRGNDFTKPFSDKTSRTIDAEIHRIVDECHERCKNLLIEKSAEVEKVAQRLLSREVITREDMIELLGERPFPDQNDAFDKYIKNRDSKKQAKKEDGDAAEKKEDA